MGSEDPDYHGEASTLSPTVLQAPDAPRMHEHDGAAGSGQLPLGEPTSAPAVAVFLFRGTGPCFGAAWG